MSKTYCVIPDVQVKPGNDTSFLHAVGSYIAEKKPDVIVCLGDFADMPSLSEYDRGKKSFEGRRYSEDILATNLAMEHLMLPIEMEIHRLATNKKKRWRPELHLTLGNHEDRISRVIESDPRLEGTIGLGDLSYGEFGWTVYDYKEVIVLDGIAFSHYFTTGAMGRPVTNARLLVNKKHMSCIQGHNQKMDIYTEYRADGKMITGLFAGCCYLHNEDYLGPQGNDYFRGIHMLYEVEDGQFYTHSITLDYLVKRHARMASRN